ncbi:MAG TPA: LacI family DNA-binding transcriptional regulator [Candidatus Limnocylindrales bacterium]|jgi:LacI family transcriptional regulator|nr:LacI family DNA-binding transcriptional regulator [Candidatus Limnocylindrales bacterium]
MVRLKDIAERTGVSVMTVSKALRDEPDVSAATKARIKAVAQQMGYVPDSTAQGLRTRTTKLFGLVIPSLANPIFSRIILAVQERAFEMGYDVLLAYTLNVPEREEACIRRFLSRRVDGFIISPVYRIGNEAPIYQELLARRVPTIILGHTAPFCSHFVNVEADDLQAAYSVTQHFLKQGHKRIAYLSGPAATPWNQERFEGYRRALREAGMDVDDKLVFQAGRTMEDGTKAAMQMINEGTEATAVQAVNDLVAAGCAEAFLRQRLRIPQDISIAGFGNTLLSEYFLVPLTTVNQPKHRLGLAAMDALLQLLKGQRPDSKRLPTELIVRASSGTPPATLPLARLKTPNT